MTTETAQPETAAESEVAPIDAAAHAFKVHLGQAEPVPARDEKGRFTSQQSEGDEIEAEADAPDGVTDEAENDAETVDTEEAADEAQPDPVEMPASWAKEDADVWTALPPEAQAKIAEREGQRDAAVNQKFQEAANVRKTYESLSSEAQTSRETALALIDQVQNLIVPQRPPVSMLNPQSSDYNPDAYHLANAQYEQATELLTALGQQRQQIAAQHKDEAEKAHQAAFAEIESKARPALFADVPELNDPVKAGPVLNELVQYALGKGIPADTFSAENAGNVSSAELHILWEAAQYRKLKAAQAKVKAEPKPEPKKPQPAVKPGVATPRGAQEQARLKGAFDRLSRSGSVEDGAAVFKHFLKGNTR